MSVLLVFFGCFPDSSDIYLHQVSGNLLRLQIHLDVHLVEGLKGPVLQKIPSILGTASLLKAFPKLWVPKA